MVKHTEMLEPKASSPKGSYTVLARRYRSRDFDELIGQEPIARTLRNAVASGRTAHAYFFCGSRGVGKTSMARILAKALNVTGDLDQADEIAEAILRGDDLDVIEIDGASNRGINEARDLIAAAGLSPARCRYKIYIIDEVHQITKDAFNALLKTMEEPPSHVKFILCTTEPHKVPATIQSRCQRFDFRLLSTAEIAGQLRRILQEEGIGADDQVVAQIAQLGHGSMRDALSLLDRLLAAGEPTLTMELLEQMLGLPDHALAVKLVDAIAAGDAPAVLEAGAALLDRGATVDQALEVLIEHLRSLLLIVTCGAESELVELSAEARQAAASQATSFDAPGLVHMIALCDAVARNARGSAAARALFDAALVRLCLSERFADIAALLDGAPAKTGGSGAGRPKKKEAVTASSSPPPAEPEVLVEPKETEAAGPPDEGRDLWAKAQALASDSPNEHALVENLSYCAFDGQTLRLAIATSDEGLARWLTDQPKAVARLVQRATSRSVDVILDEPAAKPADGPTSTRKRIEAAEDIPIVRTAMEIFNASVVDVQDAEAGDPDDV